MEEIIFNVIFDKEEHSSDIRIEAEDKKGNAIIEDFNNKIPADVSFLRFILLSPNTMEKMDKNKIVYAVDVSMRDKVIEKIIENVTKG